MTKSNKQSNKPFFPSYSIINCDKSQRKKQTHITFLYDDNALWYQSVVGVSFFIITLVLWLYSIFVVSLLQNTLIKGSRYNDDEFKFKYGISRRKLQIYQGLFIFILVLTTSIVFSLIWVSLPSNIKCILFNQYTVFILIVFILIVSCFTESDISSKPYAKEDVKIFNLIVLIISILFIFLYFIGFVNHHYKFLK